MDTSCQKTRHSVGLMERSKAKVLGVVFNGVKDIVAAAGYGSYSERYQYGYGKEQEKYQKHYAEQ